MSTEDFVNAENAFVEVMNELAGSLASKGIKLPEDELIIVDVGSGHMPYGPALEKWAFGRARKARIFAVDPAYNYPDDPSSIFHPDSSNSSFIEQIARCIEYASPQLEREGVKKIGLITLFNPRGSEHLPQIKDLGKLCKDTPIVGAIDGRRDHVYYLERSLYAQGYKVTSFDNTRDVASAFGFDYSPLFVAVPE